MAGLNARKIKSKSKFVEQPLLAVDNYPARVVQVVDLGLQDGGEWKGEKKPPANVIRITYELVDAFMVDKDGKEQEDKPLWLSEDLKLYSPDADLAKCNKRYKAIDPTEVFDFDWSQIIGCPCTVLTIHKESKGKTYCNIGNVTPYIVSKRNPELPEVQGNSSFFSLAEPDLEVFNSYPEWIRDKITGNLEFNGSPLQQALDGGESPKAQPKAPEPEFEAEEEDFDDIPF